MTEIIGSKKMIRSRAFTGAAAYFQRVIRSKPGSQEGYEQIKQQKGKASKKGFFPEQLTSSCQLTPP